MKVSNILTIVAILAGGGAAYYAYLGWESLAGPPFDEEARSIDHHNYADLGSTERVLSEPMALLMAKDARQRLLAGRESDHEAESRTRRERTAELEGLEAEISELTNTHTRLVQERTAKQNTREQNQTTIAQNAQRITALKTELQATGTLEELRESITTRINRLTEVRQELVLEQERLANAISRRRDLEGALSSARTTERMQQSGEMVETFSTTVREVYGRWGFVVINAGSNQGVNARSFLEVRRGSAIIAELQVTTLEPNVAVCAVLEDSLSNLVNIRPGDVVYVSQRSHPSLEPVVQDTDFDMPADAVPVEDDGGIFGGFGVMDEAPPADVDGFDEVEPAVPAAVEQPATGAPTIDPANPFEF